MSADEGSAPGSVGGPALLEANIPRIIRLHRVEDEIFTYT
jgi:hypothetical protein